MRCAPRWTGPATVARIERSEIRRGPCGPASDLHRCDGLSATLYEMEVSRRQVRLQYVVQQQLIAGTEVDQRIRSLLGGMADQVVESRQAGEARQFDGITGGEVVDRIVGIAGTKHEGVGAATSDQRVVAGAAVNSVDARGAGDGIRQSSPGDVLDAAQFGCLAPSAAREVRCVLGPRFAIRIGQIDPDGRAEAREVDGVDAAAAVDRIVAAGVADTVVLRVARDGVRERRPDDILDRGEFSRLPPSPARQTVSVPALAP